MRMPMLQRLIAYRCRSENPRNRRQTRREPQPGAPAYGGAGAPLAGMRPGSGMQAHRLYRVLVHTYAVASPKGPLLHASVRTPGEDSEHSMGSILVGFRPRTNGTGHYLMQGCQ